MFINVVCWNIFFIGKCRRSLFDNHKVSTIEHDGSLVHDVHDFPSVVYTDIELVECHCDVVLTLFC